MTPRKRLGEALYPLALIAVALVTLREAGKLAPAPFDPLGPKTFPVWIAYGLLALALAMLLAVGLGRDIGGSTTSMVVGLDGDAEHERRPLVPVLLFMACLGYAALLSFAAVPFMIATGLFVFVTAMLLSPLDGKSLLTAAIAGLVIAVATDLVFRRVFQLDLP